MAIAQPKIRDTVESAYRARTTKSRELFETARTVMPGGNTRSILYFEPYPTFLECGYGCRLRDVDKNEYTDFLNNYTSLIHGHAHPSIVKAIREQVERGTAFAGPTETQTWLAKLLSWRLPSVEQVRFCNSGTEATLMAIRAAKAFTRRNKLLKLDGGYHGSHDAALVGTATPSNATHAEHDEGLFRGVVRDVLSTPANDVVSAGKIFEAHHNDLAAVIVEPVMGSAGIIPLQKEFIKYLSESARSSGALLILDEVISFRLAFGGGQQIYSLKPDLTTLGKVIGGGLPIGAFGGRAEIMSLFNPAKGKLNHSGTFNGNAAAMAAGIAALELLTEDAITGTNQLGERLRTGLRKGFQRAGIDAQVTGVGSLIGIHFTKEPIINYRDTLRGSRSVLSLLHLSLLNRGMFIAPRGLLCTSTVMSESDVDRLIFAFEDALSEVQHEACSEIC